MILSINSKTYSGVSVVTEKGYPENSILIKIINDAYKISDFNDLFGKELESVKVTRNENGSQETIDLSQYKYVNSIDKKITDERKAINITLVTNAGDIVESNSN